MALTHTPTWKYRLGHYSFIWSGLTNLFMKQMLSKCHILKTSFRKMSFSHRLTNFVTYQDLSDCQDNWLVRGTSCWHLESSPKSRTVLRDSSLDCGPWVSNIHRYDLWSANSHKVLDVSLQTTVKLSVLDSFEHWEEVRIGELWLVLTWSLFPSSIETELVSSELAFKPSLCCAFPLCGLCSWLLHRDISHEASLSVSVIGSSKPMEHCFSRF